MKKIVLGFIIIIVSFTILIFYYGLKTKKVYDTEGLVGKPILKIDLELLNSEKIIMERKTKMYRPLEGSFANVCTEFNIPDLTKKVPVTLIVNVKILRTITQR